MDHLKRMEESDNPEHILRLLISPTTDRRTAEAMLRANESYKSAEDESTRDVDTDKSIEAAREEIRRTLEHMPQSEGELLAVKKLIDLIRKKKIQIKVYTQSQLHAKAYIFELDSTQLIRAVAIVGSSNLSISGIQEHAELNLQTAHPGDHKELLEWFDRHWNHISCQDFTKEIADILKGSWAGDPHTPQDVYGKAALHEHGDIELLDMEEEPGGPRVEIKLFDFQKRAVGEAIHTLDTYGGVIIADVVGMGKTYVGCAILRHFQRQHYAKPLIICPPHLKDMWVDYLRKFDIHGEVESRYKIGMEDNILQKYMHCDTVLIDESHNFRNSHTYAYDALSKFLDEKTEIKVIMLTATPISNTIRDLKNQLKLFPAEGLERIPVIGAANLDEYFKGLEDSNKIVPDDGIIKIQDLLRHVLIRRIRGQIIERYAKSDTGGRYYLEHPDGRKYFPKRNLQNPEEYDIDKVYNNAFDTIERTIESLRMARYVPGKYIRDEFLDEEKYHDLASISKPLASITRTSLLKRMESSIKAFDTSVRNFQKGYRLFKQELERGTVPLGKKFNDVIYKMIDDDYDPEDYEQKTANIESEYDIAAFKIDAWKADLDWDLSKFAEILGHLQGAEYEKRDDKLHKLRDLISKHDEKVLVFSESAETVKYICRYLQRELGGRRIEQIDSKRDQKTKTSLIRRFDPEHNAGSDLHPDQELDILVSTDVLSEGVNLHACRIVINYDFHWNPVRLIQRVGRIDRIGSEHPIIEIFNFLPTTRVEESLSLRERVANKIRTIRRIIGTDQQILEATEDVDENGVSNIYDPQGDDSILDPKLRTSLLDIPDTESEKHADSIRNDDVKMKHFEDLQFGIRGVAGSSKLFIACEVEDILLQTGKKGSSTDSLGTMRRYYEITTDVTKTISASSFLKQVGDNSHDNASCDDSRYNELVAKAWDRFNRDIKDERARRTKRKHQTYFERKLMDIATNKPKLADRAKRLRPFVTSRMRHTHQPYRSLIELHKKIDQDARMDEESLIVGLEKIKQRYGDISYKRILRKPKILYSLMVE